MPNCGFRPCSSGSSACLRERNTRSSFSSMTCNGIPLPCPELERALATRADGARAIFAKPERDMNVRMATRALVNQHPTVRRANAALGQEPARAKIPVMTGDPIVVETGGADRRGRRRYDHPGRNKITIQEPGARPSGVPRRQRHAAQSRGIDGAGSSPQRDLARVRRNIVDRRQLLNGHADDIARWRDAIKEAVGNQGRLLTDLIPDLARLMGPQPTVAVLSPVDAELRFQTVFQRFVGVFARAEHPLVIFVDDL